MFLVYLYATMQLHQLQTVMQTLFFSTTHTHDHEICCQETTSLYRVVQNVFRYLESKIIQLFDFNVGAIMPALCS